MQVPPAPPQAAEDDQTDTPHLDAAETPVPATRPAQEPSELDEDDEETPMVLDSGTAETPCTPASSAGAKEEKYQEVMSRLQRRKARAKAAASPVASDGA